MLMAAKLWRVQSLYLEKINPIFLALFAKHLLHFFVNTQTVVPSSAEELILIHLGM